MKPRTDWKVSTAPVLEPITLAEAKLHLRVTSTIDDDLIETLIQAAREWCEGYAGRAYITQSITLKMDSFVDVLDLPRPPLVSVTTVKYVDSAGDTKTLSDSVYTVDTASEPGRLLLGYNQSWPTIRSVAQAVEIIFVAGYGATTATVPYRVKAAMKLLIGHLYEHREVASEIALKEVPFAVESLLAVDRMQNL